MEVAEDASDAEPIGGNILGGKWGTPDVIGVLKPSPGDIIGFAPQIVSAEIKIDPGQPVVAFGQAVAYRLFSHRSYIVVPNTTTTADLDRLKALASHHGIGLVTFTPQPDVPDFTIVVLPVQSTPDMYYANQMATQLKASNPKLCKRLFG